MYVIFNEKGAVYFNVKKESNCILFDEFEQFNCQNCDVNEFINEINLKTNSVCVCK